MTTTLLLPFCHRRPGTALFFRPNAALIGFAALASLLSVPVNAQGLAVSPVSRTDLEGDSRTTFPLGRSNIRFQQIHADLPASLTTIAGHGYRRDAIDTRGMVDPFQVELEIQMSIASTTPDSPSRTFAQNRGANPVTVLPRTTLSFPGTNRPSADPASSFELLIPYAVPFQRPPGSVVCMEIIIYGNQTSTGANRNFNPYIDAHELTRSGSTAQPGYRFGTGCSSLTRTANHTASFEFLRNSSDLVLDISSRFGAPTLSVNEPAFTTLLVGFNPVSVTWPSHPACVLMTQIAVHVPLPGTNDTDGDWDGQLPGLATLPLGLRFPAQLVAGNLSNGDLTFSDGSLLTVPGLEATPIAVSRVSASSDRDATTGTTSFSVPVTKFF